MSMPQVERLPPPTIEFLREVRGIEAARLRCENCSTVRVVSWADLGLPDDTPFPPAAAAWRCSACGGTGITATPELPGVQAPRSKAPSESPAAPKPSTAAAKDFGAGSSALRERLDAVMARLGKPER